VTSAGYVLLRLPLEVRDLFKEWLMANFPDKYRHVMSLIRQTRGGKDYDAEWGKRMKGGGPYAWMIGRRISRACERLKLNEKKSALSIDRFAHPRAAESNAQLSLF
jgi:DNA repair photolyase